MTRNVLIVTAVLAVLMFLCPPWEIPGGLQYVTARISWDYPLEGSFVGYSPLVSPPTMAMRRRVEDPYRPFRYEPCVVSWSILAVQYVALLLVSGAALAMQKRSHG
jgi:hypothetical protein